MSVAAWKNITDEEMIIHLFAVQSNDTMSKTTMEVLFFGSPSVAELRVKVSLMVTTELVVMNSDERKNVSNMRQYLTKKIKIR